MTQEKDREILGPQVSHGLEGDDLLEKSYKLAPLKEKTKVPSERMAYEFPPRADTAWKCVTPWNFFLSNPPTHDRQLWKVCLPPGHLRPGRRQPLPLKYCTPDPFKEKIKGIKDKYGIWVIPQGSSIPEGENPLENISITTSPHKINQLKATYKKERENTSPQIKYGLEGDDTPEKPCNLYSSK